MNKTEYLLTCLSEEASEIIKSCSKSIRFGLNSDYSGITNEEELVLELNDLIAVASLLVKEGSLPSGWMDDDLISHKQEKVQKYMEISLKPDME